MEELTGFIEHIIFTNPKNGYTVFDFMTDTGSITCVGSLHAPSEGENLVLRGEYTTHATYGRQFSVNSYDSIIPTGLLAIRRYLGSGLIKGVGDALAGKIVDMFGEDTFRVIEEEPELLVRVKGISERKAREIAISVLEKQELRRVMLFLQDYGISNTLAMKIYRKYGYTVFDIMKSNPYKMAEDIEGVGFKKADEIALYGGIARDSEFRISCGILYCLQGAAAEGHCYLSEEILLSRAAELLEVDRELVDVQMHNLAMERKIIVKVIGEEVRVYSNVFYYMELGCARRLLDLNISFETDEIREKAFLQVLASEDDLYLDEMQQEAVMASVQNGVTIITGGPGTGKTTTINRILQYFSAKGADILLAAPTGRAAKRMTEATGYEASTIQRMLGLKASLSEEDSRSFGYDKNEDNPLEADIIVIDEMSMVDLPLMNALLKAVLPGTRLVLVGDINQLPSVGPGTVLKDLIASGAFTVVSLVKIFRQDEQSDIIMNAHMINKGQMPDLSKESKDFFFLSRNDVNVILKHMLLLIMEKLPKYVHAKASDIQVLTPMRKGTLGVENLNLILQKYLNPPSPDKKEKEFSDVTFREGDKVMQIKNNYQLTWEVRGKYGIPVDSGSGVFNGDVGIIQRIDSYSETMEIMYEDNHCVSYPFHQLDELELAYAVTIHKSQGSEYPAVVMPLLSGPKQLLNRNLLYTAVTRAKSCVLILGSLETIEQMVSNEDEQKRYTGLKECIEEVLHV